MLCFFFVLFYFLLFYFWISDCLFLLTQLCLPKLFLDINTLANVSAFSKVQGDKQVCIYQ